MGEIRVIEKPDSISYDDIHLILALAHEVNEKNGFVMTTSKLTGDEIKDRIGESGKCWVALDDEKPVGTISVRIVKRNTWYAKNEIPDYMLAGVIPEYQGKHINSMLAKQVFEFAKKNEYNVIELDTAEDNRHAIDVYKHQGFILVDFVAKRNLDHYSVIMVKWINECPYSNFYCKLRYTIRRFLVKLRYKKGKIKRFGI